MSREIKFRAWDKETKEMSNDFLSKNWLKVCVESPYVELMQYTGLKDKNGIEIYEGDILAWQDHRHFWSAHDDSFLAKAKVHFDIKELTYKVGELRLMASRDFEIIGNIYEHGELLKCQTE